MTNEAAFQRKLTTFKGMMQSKVNVYFTAMIQDPMFPSDPTKLIPGGSETSSSEFIRLIRSRTVAEDYTSNDSGFLPETFKWILSLNKLQEDSHFSLHGAEYYTGKSETLFFQNRIYGYRSPVRVGNI